MAREEAEMAAGGRACSLTTVKWGTTAHGVSAKNELSLVLLGVASG
jgi:hypothetical protein